jgi:hypothetical protein
MRGLVIYNTSGSSSETDLFLMRRFVCSSVRSQCQRCMLTVADSSIKFRLHAKCEMFTLLISKLSIISHTTVVRVMLIIISPQFQNNSLYLVHNHHVGSRIREAYYTC